MTFIVEYKSPEKNDNIWLHVCNIECDSSMVADELKSPNVAYGEGYIFRASHVPTGTIVGMSCVVDGVPIPLPDLSDAGLLMDGIEGAYAHNIYNWQSDIKNHAYRFGRDWERTWFLCDDPAWLFCLAMHIPVKSMKIAALQGQQDDKEFLRLMSNKIREIIDFPEIIYYTAKYHCERNNNMQ